MLGRVCVCVHSDIYFIFVCVVQSVILVFVLVYIVIFVPLSYKMKRRGWSRQCHLYLFWHVRMTSPAVILSQITQ